MVDHFQKMLDAFVTDSSRLTAAHRVTMLEILIAEEAAKERLSGGGGKRATG